ncbi:Uncharacterised protein [Vibrio cholerae]|uniref:Uncharacterized protein n=1 Tax=Vibrio cholerae TaxID=666 RepID=A0A655S291_VIBCL|nr:Uncharacterised protein [Vibrio cholerae]CSC07152.1 Uncharacterised protein [Vibrio cholerae]
MVSKVDRFLFAFRELVPTEVNIAGKVNRHRQFGGDFGFTGFIKMFNGINHFRREFPLFCQHRTNARR